MTDEEEWFAVSRTWFVRAPDWYTASRRAKQSGRTEDELNVRSYRQTDPREALHRSRWGRDPEAGMPKAEVTERLRVLFDQSGETFRSLSRRIAVSHSTIAQAVNGRIVPRWKTLVLIIEGLGGDPNDFLSGDDDSGGGGDRTRVSGV